MKKNFIILCFILTVGSGCFASALGGYDAGSLNSQYMRDLRMHDAITRARSQSAIVKQNTQAEQVKKEQSNTNIQSIKYVNNKAFPASTLDKITSFGLNKPATDKNISEIKNLIAKYYQSNGYYSVIVLPSTRNLAAGELIFEIQEGTKDSVVVE